MRVFLRCAGFALVCAVVLAPRASQACAALGESGPIAIRGEEALIVWDDARNTEHFIRRAFFKGAPADFGFLVPTPTRPTLAEVPTAVFDRLFEIYKRHEPAHAMNMRGPIAAAAVAPVQVIAEQKVAGLDATILRATDGKSLQAWLATHKYPSSPALEKWLAPYVAKREFITAFKLAGGAQTDSAIRMTFTTNDGPMFPYSEPASDGTPRPFRLSIISAGRFDGFLGKQSWNSQVRYAGFPSRDEMHALLDGVVPKEAMDKLEFITVFDDPRSVRGNLDLRFVGAERDQRLGSSITTKIAP